MPEIQAIEEFKSAFARLGNEAEIRKQRGESLPEIKKPQVKFDDLVGDNVLSLFDDADEVFNSNELFNATDDFTNPEDMLDGLDDTLGTDSFNDEQDTSNNFDFSSFEDSETKEDLSFDSNDFSFNDILKEEGSKAPITESDFIDENPLEDEDTFDEIDDSVVDENKEFTFEYTSPDEVSLDSLDEKEEEFQEDYENEFQDDLNEEFEEEFGGEVEEEPENEIDEEFEENFSDENFNSSLAEYDLPDEETKDENSDDEFGFDNLALKKLEADSGEDLEERVGEDVDEDIDEGEFIQNEENEISKENEFESKEHYPPTDITEQVDEETTDPYDDEKYKITNKEFDLLKKNLAELPINLKLIIEELIGEKDLSGENLDKLLKALIAGKTSKEIAAITSKIVGRKIKIPAQYERRSVEALEKEKNSFSYLFKKNFIPMFRIALIVATILGLLLYGGYNLVFRPIYAESLYRQGYNEILSENNNEANKYFQKAFAQWKRKSWFFKYALAFTEHKQFVLAEEKYEQLLSWYPDDKQGILDYARLEYKTLGKYPKAEALLKNYIFYNLTDYDTRLMLGDVYLDWAREIDHSKYEDARFQYAKLLSQYGGRDELLFRMLKYFIRTDNYEEAMRLYHGFQQNEKSEIDPEIYAELAGYLIERSDLRYVNEILMKARYIKEDIPEIHYQLARYFDLVNIHHEEKKALLAAISLFKDDEPLTRYQKGQFIDSYNRYGMCLYRDEMYIDSEKYFQNAATYYNEALKSGQLKPQAKYGHIFSNLGDIAYYISGNYGQALDYYIQAQENAYSTSELKYKKGYIYYLREDYKDALSEFYDSAGGYSSDRSLLFATANTLFNRNDYYLAEGYYKELLDSLEKEYFSIKYLLLDSEPEHRTLVENIIKVKNNLAVTKYRLYERTKNPNKTAEAMVLLTDSIELYDKLVRDPNTLEKPDTVNLSYLNSKAIFYPLPDYQLQIYQNIPKEKEF